MNKYDETVELLNRIYNDLGRLRKIKAISEEDFEAIADCLFEGCQSELPEQYFDKVK